VAGEKDLVPAGISTKRVAADAGAGGTSMKKRPAAAKAFAKRIDPPPSEIGLATIDTLETPATPERAGC
jgi:hypothetical protein